MKLLPVCLISFCVRPLSHQSLFATLDVDFNILCTSNWSNFGPVYGNLVKCYSGILTNYLPTPQLYCYLYFEIKILSITEVIWQIFFFPLSLRYPYRSKLIILTVYLSDNLNFNAISASYWSFLFTFPFNIAEIFVNSHVNASYW